MKRLIKSVCILFLFCINANSKALDIKSFSNNESLISVSKEYNISKYLIMAISKKESALNPYAIGMKTKGSNDNRLERIEFFLKYIDCSYKRTNNFISIYPKNLKDAMKAYTIIKHYNIRNYGIGLSQISRANIEKLNIDVNKLFSEIKYSLTYSAKILNTCAKVNKFNLHNSVECYYKGTNKKNYTKKYSNEVLAIYKKIKYDLGV